MLLFLAIVVIIQLAIYLFCYSRFADYKPVQLPVTSHPPVSIVICARDEINSLKKNLPAILHQKYPAYEVIVVNDNSEDETELFLRDLQTEFPHLVVRSIHHSTQKERGKKYPLMLGIRAATHDHVLLSDADCYPSGDHWISDMMMPFSDDAEIVLGYAPFKKCAGLLNKFIRYECFTTALSYFSFSLAGNAYMGVGRNLAYRKELFFNYNVYKKYPNLLSGDDDLLINEAAKPWNTAIQIRKSAFMYSEPKHTWEEYWNQKKRHVSTARYYRWRHKLLLTLVSLSSTLFYVALILCLVYTNYFLEIFFLYGLKMLVQGIVLKHTMKKLEEADLFLLFPLLDILFLFYYAKLIRAVVQTQPNTWK